MSARAENNNRVSKWDLLHKADLIKRKETVAKLQEQALLKEMDEKKQCTFQPAINQPYRQVRAMSRSTSSVYERNLKWKD